MNNRLDFISKIAKEGIDAMCAVRDMFMQVDEVLKAFHDIAAPDNSAAKRSIELSRTKIEEGLQHAIKSLCLIHEEKGE